MTDKPVKKALALSVALASMALASIASGADPRSETLTPYPALVAGAQSVGDVATLTWSRANALQAVTYMAGYAFTYEQVRNFGCGGADKDIPMFNELLHSRELVDAKTSEDLNILTPNNDTLYSYASLALDGEPVVFHAPDSLNEGNRYWSLMLQDAASNVPYVLGSNGTGTGDFVIAWRGWEGQLPKNLPVFLMDTPFVWPLIRTGVGGPDDLEAVKAIQDAYAYTPLSEYCAAQRGKNQCKFPRGPQVPVVLESKAEEVCLRYPENFNSTPTGLTEHPLAFWEGVNVFTSLNPPPGYETSTLQMYQDILVGPGQRDDFQVNYGDVDPIILSQLEQAPGIMGPLLPFLFPSLAESENGWDTSKILADYGNLETGVPYDYLLRGVLNMYGPGALPSSEAVYFSGVRDADGNPLSGANTYEQVLAVPPPVGAFWSVTMYDAATGFLVDNGSDGIVDNDIYSVGSRTAVPEPDGTIILTISHSPSGVKPGGVANWLPAPEGGFYVVFRTYVPLDPDYFPPPLVAVP